MKDAFSIRMSNTELVNRISDGLTEIGIRFELKVNGDMLQFLTHNQNDCDMAAAYIEMSEVKAIPEKKLATVPWAKSAAAKPNHISCAQKR